MSRHRSRQGSRPSQTGMALLVALLMLVIMTATTLAVFRMSLTGTQIVGNMQFGNEALTSANSAIEEAISSSRLFESPNQLFLNACGEGDGGQFNRRCYDLNNDGEDDIHVDIAPPTCVQVNIILNAALNWPADSDCLVGDPPELAGQIGLIGGNSLCSNTIWEVTATAQDAAGATGARMTVVQGVGVRVKTAVAQTFCNPPPPI